MTGDRDPAGQLRRDAAAGRFGRAGRHRFSRVIGQRDFADRAVEETAGVIVHQAIPGVPLGLAFTCLLPAVLGSLAAAPFAMVLLAAFTTRVGALQTSPILIAVVTAFLTVEGVKYFRASRKPADAPARSGPGL